MLSDDTLMRYSRQILVPQLDVAAQEAFSRATVLVVGAGGLGNPASLYLAGAGVGRLIIVDPDTLEASNLHRQVGFRETDLGDNKAQALARQVCALNGDIDVQAVPEPADAHWLAKQVPQVSLVLDCSDNFATRLAVNRACVEAAVPLVSGAAIRWEGQLAVFDLRQPDAGCYACLYGYDRESEEPPEREALCSESGIVGPVVGTVGTLQALQALKLLAGIPIPRELHLFDGHRLQWRALAFQQDKACPVCAEKTG